MMMIQSIEARMFAALNATNEAILRVDTEELLFQAICDAAVEGGRFKATAVMLAQGDGSLSVAAGAGSAHFKTVRSSVSVDINSAYGHGLAGIAFRSGRSAITNDYLNDDRLRPWHDSGRQAGVGAAAAAPIAKGGRTIGVVLFFFSDAGSINRRIVSLIERMAENLSFALDNFERERERQRANRSSERMTHMFAALSATNEAVLRATCRDEMFRLVCDSVAQGGRWLGAAAIFMADAGSQRLKPVAVSGQADDLIARLPLSIDPHDPYGGGLHGPAFREGKLVVSYDVSSDPRTSAWYQPGTAPFGAAVVPLRCSAEIVGILIFFFGRTSGRHDEEIVRLMSRIGDNVSYGLEAFAREDHKDRLNRMFEALSATNEAIMRAKNRGDLFQMVCDAAVVGGKFTSTTVGLVQDGNDCFHIAASAGPNADKVRAHRYPVAGDGLLGQTYRAGEPTVFNDMLSSHKDLQWPYDKNSPSAARSGVGLPLRSGGRIVGSLLFVAGEKDAFTPDFVSLLERLAENVSFALANFDRADEKLKAEERIEHLATHDGLTGLPNRNMFSQLLHFSIEASRRYQRRFAVLFIDLDRFKIINDSLGHAAGDTLLIEMAARLRANLRGSDVVARLGGDEFVVILDLMSDDRSIEQVARKLLAALSDPVMVDGHECQVSGSIGVAIYPADGSDENTLMKNADMAMYLAKQEGKNDVRFFSKEIKAQSVDRLAMETALRRAIERNELVLNYQPKVDVLTHAITGLEALLRWNHPERGLLAPMKFIPLAEETGLIVPIGRWVIRTACEQNVAWQRQGLPPMSIAVNLSPRQFADDGLLDDIDRALADSGMAPELLQLEITESMVMLNVERAVALLDAIQERGIRLAIDDFGTGYSSMSVMKKFPIDTIKIDRSFVRDLPQKSEDKAIARAIIGMGKALGLTVVAEGVETAEQEVFLRKNTCDEVQGFLFSKPLAVEDVSNFVRAHLVKVDAPSIVTNLVQGGYRKRSDKLVRAGNGG